MKTNYFFFLEDTTLDTARRVAARPTVPVFGAALTTLLGEDVLPGVLPAAGFAALRDVPLLGAFLADISISLNLY